MKIISLATLLASLTAAAILPVRLDLTGMLLFAAGVVLVMVQDYSARRALRFETARSAASQLTGRDHVRRRSGRVVFRAPALATESNRLAA